MLILSSIDKKVLNEKLNLLIEGFQDVLYSEKQNMVDGKVPVRLAGDDPNLYRNWEWTQGVGLYGIWKIYESTKDPKCLEILTTFYDNCLAEGLPAKNVNTCGPVLALSYLAVELDRKDYMAVCEEWAEYAMYKLPRSECGGIQHMTSERMNNGELWDDTLFMTVLMLANMGKILHKQEYIDEAVYQFLLHTQYLTDTHTGLWYHGFTFEGRHHFAGALWGRGNCWVTAAIPIFIEMIPLEAPVRRFFVNALEQQVKTLAELQCDDGLWHTLLNDPTSYKEASATCGFGYGILAGIKAGILSEKYAEIAKKSVKVILENIDDKGVLQQVSYGTPMGRETTDFYKQIPITPMPYGQALAILFLSQAKEQL